MARDVATCLNVFFGSIALLRIMREVDIGMAWHVVRRCQVEVTAHLPKLGAIYGQRRGEQSTNGRLLPGRERRGVQRLIYSTGFILGVQMKNKHLSGRRSCIGPRGVQELLKETLPLDPLVLISRYPAGAKPFTSRLFSVRSL